MATDKTFTVAGTSVLNGVMTFRFANGEAKKRMWVLKHNQHVEINLIDLAKPMSKVDATAFLIANNHPGAAIAIVPGGSSKGKTPEQLAAEEAARKAAEELRKRTERNDKRKAARAAAKASKAAEGDDNFISSIPTAEQPEEAAVENNEAE